MVEEMEKRDLDQVAKEDRNNVKKKRDYITCFNWPCMIPNPAARNSVAAAN